MMKNLGFTMGSMRFGLGNQMKTTDEKYSVGQAAMWSEGLLPTLQTSQTMKH